MEMTDIVLHASISNVIVYDLQEFKSHSTEQCFLTYPPIQDRDIHMFTRRRQNRSHMVANVGQALLNSRQPTHDI